MGLWNQYVVPQLIRRACGVRAVERQRTKVVPHARGRVLEVGVGSGLNLRHYNASTVDHVVGLDPSPALLRVAQQAARGVQLPVTLLQGDAQRLPLDDASVDSVVVTYTLCSVPDVQAALAEVARVLAPGGRLHFCEHGWAPDSNVQRWQQRLAPLWKHVGGGCHLTRDIPVLLATAGFEVDGLETMYLPGLRFMTYNTWGQARCPPGS